MDPQSIDDTDVLEWIAANVRVSREARGMTQEQLVDATGIELRQVSRIETASAGHFGVVTLLRIARALETTADALMEPAQLERRGRGRPKQS
jgi:transcriptional regulator with XRE-family HTH domain